MRRPVWTAVTAISLCLSFASVAQGAVVISQVYGGGGNSGGVFQNDFIELHNNGTGAVDVSGYSVQYGSAANAVSAKTNLTGTIPAGGYYLVQQAAGAANPPQPSLPSPDATGTIALSATNGKVVLASTQTQLSCGAAKGSCAGDVDVLDTVGYGSASEFEGAAAAPVLSNSTAAIRDSGGCTETNDNAADFTAGTPTPRNRGSATQVCGATGPTGPTGSTGSTGPGAGSCTAGVDEIAEVQGPDATSPRANQSVTVEGIVTGDFQGAAGLNGVFVQDPTPDSDPATSDGIFVFDPDGPAVAAGDRICVTGTATEAFGQTQIGSITARATLDTGRPLPAPTTFDLPADNDARERLEGMRFVVPEALSVTESRNADNFGELRLSSDGVLITPTEIAEPGPAAAAIAAENGRRNIILDDARNGSFVSPFAYLDPMDSLRRGDTTTDLTGIMSVAFSQYRIQPTATPAFVQSNPRPAPPSPAGGDFQIGSFNVLNYFITFDERSQDRGATSQAEFDQQEAKIVEAINGLGAEVVALQEIQDTSDEMARLGSASPDQALDTLIAALNDDPGSDLVWAKVPAPSPYTNTDEIRNALIYQPAKAERVGAPGELDDPTFVNARRPLSQTFRAGAETFTVIGNHFKSKGGTGTGDNANTGQGSFNGDRTRQGRALLGYIRELQSSSGDRDVLALGDLNSYTKEDPIDVLVDGGLVDVAAARIAEPDRYSFVFDGAQGNLDHEIATPELNAKLGGAEIWHVNADEPDAFQYTGPEAFFAPDAFAASDHDPSLVTLADTGATGPTGPTGPRRIDGPHRTHGRHRPDGPHRTYGTHRPERDDREHRSQGARRRQG